MAEETVVPSRLARPNRTAPVSKGAVLAGWLSSTDHKVIGHMYLITSFLVLLADRRLGAQVFAANSGGASGTRRTRCRSACEARPAQG